MWTSTKYLGERATNQNYIHNEVKILDSGNAWHHSVQKRFPPALYLENTEYRPKGKIKK